MHRRIHFSTKTVFRMKVCSIFCNKKIGMIYRQGISAKVSFLVQARSIICRNTRRFTVESVPMFPFFLLILHINASMNLQNVCFSSV